MPCLDRERLERKHREAEGRFDSARAQLRTRIGISTKEKFALLNDALNREWEGLLVAQVALERHVHDHGCKTADQASAGS